VHVTQGNPSEWVGANRYKWLDPKTDIRQWTTTQRDSKALV
jgi:hypothetical protein